MIMNCLQGPNSHLYPQGQPPCGICDPKLLFKQVRFFDGSKLIKNKVGGLFFLSWFNLMRFKITFSPPCYSFKVLEFADRLNTRVTGESEDLSTNKNVDKSSSFEGTLVHPLS